MSAIVPIFLFSVPGPCDPEDLIDGIIFAANYLGSTQLMSDKTPSKNIRMMQAQEAVSRIKVKTSAAHTPDLCFTVASCSKINPDFAMNKEMLYSGHYHFTNLATCSFTNIPICAFLLLC